MAIYKLEDSDNIYISPRYYGNKFVYKMAHIVGEVTRIIIRTIDLRTDKLIIHGIEIDQSMLQRLHDSLVLRPKVGVMYVNCNGACYVLVPGKGCYRPIKNVIFDWSPYGVIVPNSPHDSLRKQLEQKQKEIDQMDELKEQLSACQKDKQEMEVKLQKVCDQLSLVDFELETNKVELESCKKEAMELEEQLFASRKENESKLMELQKVHDQLSSTKFELECAKKQLESSNTTLEELEYKLSSTKEENQDMKREIQQVYGELSSVKLELCSTQTQLESSNKVVKDLEEQLFACLKDGRDMKMELRKVQEQLSSANNELESTKKQVQELKGQDYTIKRQYQNMEANLQRASSHLWSLGSEVKSTVQKLPQQLMSMFWSNEHNRCQHSDQPRSHPLISDTRSRFTVFKDPMNNFTIAVTIEEDDENL